MQSMKCADSAQVPQSSGMQHIDTSYGDVVITSPDDRENAYALLCAARGTLISLMINLEGIESLLPVDSLEDAMRQASVMDTLILSAMGGVA